MAPANVSAVESTAIDARRHASGDQSFHYIGGKGFTAHAGELRFKHGIVEGDINGDGSADFRIRVHAATADDGVATLAARTSFHLTADDFIL